MDIPEACVIRASGGQVTGAFPVRAGRNPERVDFGIPKVKPKTHGLSRQVTQAGGGFPLDAMGGGVDVNDVAGRAGKWRNRRAVLRENLDSHLADSGADVDEKMLTAEDDGAG